MRFFHHQFRKQLDSTNKLNSLFHRRFHNHQEKYDDNNLCTRMSCEISNECIRLQRRHNHTKFRHHCRCLERPCRHEMKFS